MSTGVNNLVVDDLSNMRPNITKLPHGPGYQNVFEADDGHTGLPLLRRGQFDFLITDWNMPGMGGLVLLRQVTANPSLARLPVLMFTSKAKREQNLEAARSSVNGYVFKPWMALTLTEKIDRNLTARVDR